MPHTYFNLDTIKNALQKRAKYIIANAEILLIRVAENYINRYINELLRSCPLPNFINQILKGKENVERALDSISKKLRSIRRVARTARTLTVAIAIIVDIMMHFSFRRLAFKSVNFLHTRARLVNILIDIIVFVRRIAKTILRITDNVETNLDTVRVRLSLIDRLCGHCLLNPDAELQQNARVINPFLIDPNNTESRLLLKEAFKRPGNTTLEQDMLQDLKDRKLVLEDGGPFNLPGGNILDPIISADGEGLGLTPEELQEAIDGTTMEGKLDDNTVVDETHRSPRGNIYTLRIEVETDNLSEVAQRRRAIALDTRGVVVLKGPFSYASSTKVLKEEVRLRIDNQLP